MRRIAIPDAGSPPCNGCTLCCKNDAVRLMWSEQDRYEREPHPTMKHTYILAHKPNGDCFYLGEDGCTIHGRAPQQCQEFDCRLLAASFSFTQARKMDRRGVVRFRVWRRGRDLLKEIP